MESGTRWAWDGGSPPWARPPSSLAQESETSCPPISGGPDPSSTDLDRELKFVLTNWYQKCLQRNLLKRHGRPVISRLTLALFVVRSRKLDSSRRDDSSSPRVEGIFMGRYQSTIADIGRHPLSTPVDAIIYRRI